MDTTEELNGTYFYKEISNVNPGELFFWVLLDKIDAQFGGITDLIEMSCIVLGLPLIKTRRKPWGTTPGTSIASKYSRQLLDVKLPYRLPTLTNASIQTLRPMMTNNLGAFVGRTVPVVGWTMLASDVTQIIFNTLYTYNTIARREDRIW
ncbi:hypothetical protein B5M10_01575 [Pluralibacter gergoviae]|uniref:STM2901 family protein n=1 Tax=Pluralibacter gergoviae TaxID=61647 RepID=UPI0005EC51A9|nr:hypothetical protein [Pluralibacter gergoviae]KJM66777.1 membrane protein [Pluralibacter gergoviae]OUR04612.1 hypothetical protein B5M10_01575 [Pluralibacter gergoviae]